MATVVETAAAPVLPEDRTLADLHEQLGGVPLERIRLHPYPGTATEKDVLETERRSGRICELIDGVLVEKAMGLRESRLAATLIHLMESYLDRSPLGIVTGEAGTMRILARQVRIPDVAFICWDRLPGGKVPEEPIPALVPDLAVEVLSPGNTEAEMERKLRDYFAAGVRLVWYIDPLSRSARAYTGVYQGVEVGPEGVLSGGDVLPGFTLSLAELFARAEKGGAKPGEGPAAPGK